MAKRLDRVLHDSIRTEDAYVQWVRCFILFHGRRHPQEMGAAELEAFLMHLAVDRDAGASTQNQALGAIPFLCREVLGRPIGEFDPPARAAADSTYPRGGPPSPPSPRETSGIGPQISSMSRSGLSRASLMRTRKLTASRPSMSRWS
jgi:Phage integrase, N-terminal SAM-like domain